MKNRTKVFIGFSLFFLFWAGFNIWIFLIIQSAKKDPNNNYFSEDRAKETIVLEVDVLSEGDFITKGNCTVFKFNYGSSFNISSIPEILDRFEKEHPKLRVKYWEVVYNQINSQPYGILFWHYQWGNF